MACEKNRVVVYVDTDTEETHASIEMEECFTFEPRDDRWKKNAMIELYLSAIEWHRSPVVALCCLHIVEH